MIRRYHVLCVAFAIAPGLALAASIGKKPLKLPAPQSSAVAASLAHIQSAPAFIGVRPFSKTPGTTSGPGFLTPMNPLVLQSTTGPGGPAPSVIWNSATGVPRVLTPPAGNAGLAAPGISTVSDPVQNARSFLAAQRATLRISDPANEFAIIGTERDELQMTHVRLKQTYAGLDVWASDVYLHMRADGTVAMFNGTYHATPDLQSVTPAISGGDAVTAVRADLTSSGSPEGLPKSLQKMLGYDGPKARLMIWHDSGNKPYLVWYVEARSGLEYDWNYFIDARSGQILDKFNSICHDGPTTASAQDLNGVQRTVNTYLSSGTYFMLDAIEPMYNAGQSSIPQNPVGGIMGLDLRGKDLNAQDTLYFSQTSNNTWNDPAVISAHVNAKITYNYYRSVFGRNTIDDKGMTIYSIVHVTSSGKPMDNAFWSSTLMCYGDGNTLFKPLAGGFDVAAHEMTHGVTQHSANLVYKDQSGALNESMSDVFAAAVDSANWTIGEQVIKDFASFPSGALRDLANPHNGGIQGSSAWQPASMSEFVTTTIDNGGVHINSGVPNNAFYRTASVIGRSKGSHIWYRALTKYLTSSAEFVDARIATESAAKDLFGPSSAELAAVQNAWTAVGVNSGTGTQPPPVPQLQGTNWVLVVNTDGNDPNSLYQVRPVLQGNSGDFHALSQTRISSRPAVSDTGGVVVFVDGAHRLRALNAGATPGEEYLDTNAVWSSVAIGPGLSSLALTSIFADTTIYYIDFTHKTSTAFKIRTQTYDGTPTGTALFCDEMSFDPTGRYLLFDTFNQARTTTGTLGFWNINILDLATGQMQSVFAPQPSGIDIGNPSFSKSKSTRFLFDRFDNTTQTDMVMGADFFKGTYGTIVGPLDGIGYPTYSGDGAMIAYHNVSTVNGVQHDAVEKISMDTSGTASSGSASSYLLDASYPNWFVIGSRVTSVDEAPHLSVPTEVQLEQNYPNPFNPTTIIRYGLPRRSHVNLSVFNTLGQQVAILQSGEQDAGFHEVRFDASKLASGTYIYRIQAGDFTQSRKLLLVK